MSRLHPDDPLVSACYLRTGTLHLVVAAGGPESGSLRGFRTLCGRLIRDADAWEEGPKRALSCGVCARVFVAAGGQEAE